MKENTKAILITVLCIVIGAFSDGLAVKAAVGTASYEALAMSINNITHIKVGTIAILMNLFCILAQLIIKRKITPDMLLQLPVALVQGSLLNLVVYNIYQGLVLTNWISRIAAATIGLAIAGVVMGIMLGEDLVCFPLQQLSSAITAKKQWHFARVQQGADIICIVLALALSLFSHTPITIREGTLIGMLIQGPLSGLFRSLISKDDKKRKVNVIQA